MNGMRETRTVCVVKSYNPPSLQRDVFAVFCASAVSEAVSEAVTRGQTWRGDKRVQYLPDRCSVTGQLSTIVLYMYIQEFLLNSILL